MKKILSILIVLISAVVLFTLNSEELFASNAQGNPAVCKPQPGGKWTCVTNFPQKCGSKGHYRGSRAPDKVVFYPPMQMTNCRAGARKCAPPMMAVDKIGANSYGNCANPTAASNKIVTAGGREFACCIPKVYLNLLN